ncbi:plastocyanin/azurin family copper-binding protein [Rhodocytophaga aerolata]|uniref:Plastocyanin/azurin family copper-binding protein n=1 Tax=Rhodocytophaga aerolata TaxID=455078 RepID=A0ABT8RFM5_9BACT|nr:plastocyanin/azurin family copper-binding protein [Rhodocytophaga aerolata]MDO1450899.1 plastocyanin/azurin family copper-binding protein [Rhodocytophaga aerolata]
MVLKIKRLFLFVSLLFNSLGLAYSQADSAVLIAIKAIPGLQFDQVRFQVKPGTRVTLVLTNEDDMSHNLLITEPGAREAVVQAAMNLGENGPKKDYVPDSPNVLWYIPVLLPEQTQSITFTAPQTTGVYPYVCTYPGHGVIMYGAMYVSTEPMPDLKMDRHVPPSRKVADSQANSGVSHAEHTTQAFQTYHPYQPAAPYLYRIFMPDASPATIAVHLPQKVSYCWDAGTCYLRYAWQGEFLANTDQWQGKGDTFGKPGGPIFFRDKTAYPLQMGKTDSKPDVAFIGYKLSERYPEFHYQVDGIDVYELIKPTQEGNGLIRTFRIPDVKSTVWFITHPGDGVVYRSSGGKWVDNRLKLSPKQARTFTIYMEKKGEPGL